MNTQKVVLITGASSGMGKETAKKLLKEGHKVYVAARRVEKMKDLEDLGAISLKMDITKTEDVKGVAKTILEKEDGLDVLVNNAGFGSYGAVEDTSIDDARYQFEVNLFGLAAITKEFLPTMREKKAGTIINISSMGGKIYTPLGAWYHATKHALEGWSDCLRLELKPFNINVVLVEPGLIKTEFGDVLNDPMMERSGNTAYAKLAIAVKKGVEDANKDKGGSDPAVIANTISKILRTNNPRTRYAVGKLAKPLIFMRRWLSDRMFDRIIMSQVK
ncbi:MAG: oxidoreductase [Bacteroidetes bacterium]|nr:oxidoreductase [Bacteroidota bacterium]